MRCNGFAVLAMLACGLVATQLRGETPPPGYAPAAYDYYQQEVPQLPPSDFPTTPIALFSDGVGEVAECEDESCDPWRLFNERCGWNLYGFLNVSATGNASNPANGFNGPVSFLDKEDVRLNQGYLILERVADTGGCGWDWGGRFDTMYGTDYVFTQAAGLELHQNGTGHWNAHTGASFEEYGLALPQMYGEIAYNNLSVKVGHFYTIIGYQVVNANRNFFITQPYTFQYGEPFTHTGALAAWKYCDEWTIHAGLVNGWDKLDAVTDQTAGLGGITYAPSHGRYTVFLSGIVGKEDGIAVPLQGTRALYSLVFTYNFSDKLQYVLQHDNGHQENFANTGTDAEWYGVNQYLFYTINECWKFGGLAEWFRMTMAALVWVTAPIRLNGSGLPAGDFAGNYYELALGANWTPHANLVVRPELRWDWSDSTIATPYVGKDSQFIAAVDAIIHF